MMSLLDEELQPTITKQYGTYILDTCLIIYDLRFRIEKYLCEWYYGAVFHLENGDSYDLVHNIHMGNRLIIRANGSWNDIPFKPASFGCLPEGMQSIEIAKD